MAFQISPGVSVSEVDLTTVVPAVSTTAGAFAGPFQWGPVGKRTLVSHETDLVNKFGCGQRSFIISNYDFIVKKSV